MKKSANDDCQEIDTEIVKEHQTVHEKRSLNSR